MDSKSKIKIKSKSKKKREFASGFDEKEGQM